MNIVSFSNNKVIELWLNYRIHHHHAHYSSTHHCKKRNCGMNQDHVHINQVLPGFVRHVFSGLMLALSSLCSSGWPRILTIWSQLSNCWYYMLVPMQLALWYFTTMFNFICLEFSLEALHIFLILKLCIHHKMSMLLSIFQ